MVEAKHALLATSKASSYLLLNNDISSNMKRKPNVLQYV